MKIKQNDADALVIVDFPYLIGAIAIPCTAWLLYKGVGAWVQSGANRETVGALVSTLIVFLAGVLFTKRSLFYFDRRRREVRWRRTGLLSHREGRVRFDEIHSATLQSLNESSHGITYRVALLTAAGDVPLTEAYTTGQARPQRICGAINRLLNISPEAVGS